MNPLFVIGAGGFGRAVVDAAVSQGTWLPIGFLDDREPDVAQIMRLPVLGKIADLPALRSKSNHLVVAIGDNRHRAAASDKAREWGYSLATIIHPRAYVSAEALVGEGSIVMAGAVVSAGVRIGRNVIVNAGAILDHDVTVEDGARLGVGCSAGGAAKIRAGAWLREGAVLLAGHVLEADRA